jgi:CRP-like cAMP-binding protein
LNDEALEEVRSNLKERQLAAGEIIFNQGDPGDELIIVEGGVLSIFMPIERKDHDIQAIRVFKPGFTV